MDGMYSDAALAKQSLAYLDRCRSKYRHVLVKVWSKKEFFIPDYLFLGTATSGWTSPPARTRALIWLRRALRDHEPVPVNDLRQQAIAAGFDWATVRLIRKTAGVKVHKGKCGVRWYLKERSI
jgi:hypothetical protein